MKVKVVGCSPAWPNPGGAQSGYLIEAEGRLLLDCGPGVLARLRELEGWPRVDAIVITHFHLDHWGDLVPWTWGAMYGPGRDENGKPALWVPPGGTETLRGFGDQLGFVDMFDNAFTVGEYGDGEPFRAAGLDVTPRRVPHYDLLTFGMRVSNSAHSLAYSGDSAPSEQLVELARDVDLFLCEATLAQEEIGMRGHLTAEEAIEAFEGAGARRLVVIHRPHELALDETLERAYDGLEITL